MNRELRNKVMPIATRVRKWTEDKARRANYNPHDLCGWCAISAAHLFRELSKEKIAAELHYVSGHCFVVVDDHVVDVTATQFAKLNAKEVYIAHIKEVDQHWFYQTAKVFTTPTALREYQIKEDWPRRQIALTR